jgi:hypothetical protein
MAVKTLKAKAHGRATVSAHIEVARAHEQRERAAGLRAVAAHYDAVHDRVIVELTNGFIFGFPANVVPGLEHATPKQRAALELSPSGAGIHWDELDADISVPGLLSDAIGRRVSMAALGRIGGKAKTSAKATAARANGVKGGRPRKRPKS